MKVAVSACAPGIESTVDPRFGRCSHFVLVDTETKQHESVENQGAFAGGGAGIQAAQLLANRGVEAVLTGQVGPNAFQTLTAAGIRVYTGAAGTVRDAVELFRKNELFEASGPSVGEKAGLMPGAGGGTGAGAGGGSGRGMGRGGGRGAGRGGGRGRGW